MKPTNQSTSGTSFHGSIVHASVNEMKQVLGNVKYYGAVGDKVQHEWEMENEFGNVFTVYDWKEYRSYTDDELIEWHIGGHDKATTDHAMYTLRRKLSC
jgi:hypothetical protein